jgi:hypothetical protein
MSVSEQKTMRRWYVDRYLQGLPEQDLRDVAAYFLSKDIECVTYPRASQWATNLSEVEVETMYEEIYLTHV